MTRITVKNLRRLAVTVARETGKPLDSFTVESANGGYMFLVNESNVLSVGYLPASRVYDLMHAYLAGYRAAMVRA